MSHSRQPLCHTVGPEGMRLASLSGGLSEGHPARFPGHPQQTTRGAEKEGREGAREEEKTRKESGSKRRSLRTKQNKKKKPEATSQSQRHSDPTQVARPERSQIVLCDTRAIQWEQDADCGASQTPWRCIVVCVCASECVCVHVWLSVDFRERLTREILGSLLRQTSDSEWTLHRQTQLVSVET